MFKLIDYEAVVSQSHVRGPRPSGVNLTTHTICPIGQHHLYPSEVLMPTNCSLFSSMNTSVWPSLPDGPTKSWRPDKWTDWAAEFGVRGGYVGAEVWGE